MGERLLRKTYSLVVIEVMSEDQFQKTKDESNSDQKNTNNLHDRVSISALTGGSAEIQATGAGATVMFTSGHSKRTRQRRFSGFSHTHQLDLYTHHCGGT